MKKLVIALSVVSLGLFTLALAVSKDSTTAIEVSNVTTVSMPRAEESPQAFTNATKKILNLKVNEARAVYINSVVLTETVKPVVDKLKALNVGTEPVYMFIDSPGGSVLDGATLVSQMEAMKVPVYTVCVKLCASMAAIIHQYGTKRYALDRAVLMFHPVSGGAQGQLNNMIALLSMLDRYVERMDNYIINKSGIARDKFNKLKAYELWIDSEDALSDNLIDSIVSVNIPLKGEVQILSGDQNSISPTTKSLQDFVNK